MRVLVTHGLGFLPQCDKIVVMDNGSITEVGSYTELVDQDGAFAEFLRNYTTKDDEERKPGNHYINILPPLYHHCTTIVPPLSYHYEMHFSTILPFL